MEQRRMCRDAGLTVYVGVDSLRFNIALSFLMVILIEIGLHDDRRTALDKLLIMVARRCP